MTTQLRYRGFWGLCFMLIFLSTNPVQSQPVGKFDIYVVHVKTGAVRQVSSVADAGEFNPDWSPTGRRLVFHQPSDGSIRTINPKNGTETLVTFASGGPFGPRPTWSRNGKWIAFANDGDIWKIRVNKKGEPKGYPIQLTTDPADDDYPSWSKNSKTIAFHSDRDGDFNIWTIPARGGTATKLTGLAGAGDLWLTPQLGRRLCRNKRLRVKISPFQ